MERRPGTALQRRPLSRGRIASSHGHGKSANDILPLPSFDSHVQGLRSASPLSTNRISESEHSQLGGPAIRFLSPGWKSSKIPLDSQNFGGEIFSISAMQRRIEEAAASGLGSELLGSAHLNL